MLLYLLFLLCLVHTIFKKFRRAAFLINEYGGQFKFIFSHLTTSHHITQGNFKKFPQQMVDNLNGQVKVCNV